MMKSNFKDSNDVITITPPKNVTKITAQKFFQFGSTKSKFLATPVVLG